MTDNTTTETVNVRGQMLCTAVLDYINATEALLVPATKQQMLDKLEISQTLVRLDETIQAMKDMALERMNSDGLLQAAKKRMDDAKALVLISGTIDGKNEQIRNAQLSDALNNDPTYQEAAGAVTLWERDITGVDVELARLRSVETALKIKARLAAATLEYLAG